MNRADLVTNALRDALTAYSNLDGPETALVIVALFGTQSKRLAPMLEEIAQSVQGGEQGDKMKEKRMARRCKNLWRVDAERCLTVRSMWQRDERDIYPPR